MHFIKAIDHSLSFISKGLAEYKALPHVLMLSPSQTRYMTPRKRPCPFEVPDGIPQLRSCVYDVDSKTTKFDLVLPSDSNRLPVLALIGDEGPRDLPAFWYLPGIGYRLVSFMDPLHRTGRDMYSAASCCGMWSVVLDTTAVLNFDHGPFLSSANFQKHKESGDLFSSVADADDDLIALVFEGLCEDIGDFPADYGSRDHIRRTIQQFKYDKNFKSMTEKVKWVRWGSHHWGLRSFLPARHRKLLACLVTALASGVQLSADTLVALGVLEPPATTVHSFY